MNESYPQFGVIDAIGHVSGPGDIVVYSSGFIEKIAPEIVYRVVANTPNGPITYEWVTPAIARPLQPPYAIRSANVGDVCGIGWFRGEPRFLIVEGIPTPELCEGEA